MKRLVSLLLVCLLFPVAALAGFAESSQVYDPGLAQYALQIAEMCYMPSMQASVLELGGYRMLGYYHGDRDESDTRHVATYAVYDRLNEEGRTEYVIAVRGTGTGEWKLNMDLMPSGEYTLEYAENFRLAAEEILDTLEESLQTAVSPQFLVTGHSRGAAVANVLGMLLTERYGAENVFAYTFATPRTVRGTYPVYENIFNIINPADLVTYLPLPAWGFERYGRDLILPVENPGLLETAASAFAARSDQSGAFEDPNAGMDALEQVVLAMSALAPDVAAAYTVQHALTHPGEAGDGEEGMTAGMFLLGLTDGQLFTTQARVSTATDMTPVQNDFTPVLMSLAGLTQAAGGSWILNMHLPAMYGAWMQVMADMQTGEIQVP